MVAFLQRIRSIHILNLLFYIDSDSMPLVMSPFPELVEYTGSGAYLPDVIFGSPLRSATITIDDTTHIESAIGALSWSTARVDDVDILSDHWDPRIFHLLAAHAHEVTSLGYGNSTLNEDGDDSVRHMANCQF
jgi:hypothetical protein